MTSIFRIWDRSSRRMYSTEPQITENRLIFMLNGGTLSPHPSFNKVVLLRNTGCIDANGKEIFEEDYVRFDDTQELGVIHFRDGAFYIDQALPFEAMTARLLGEHQDHVTVEGSSLQHPEWML